MRFRNIGALLFSIAFFMMTNSASAQCEGCKSAKTCSEVKANQALCPVSGEAIDKETYTDYNGKRIYFCCSGCAEKFKQEPEKYMEKMKTEGVVLEDAPVTQKECPVSGEPINTEIYTDHQGKRIYFCCADCKEAFIKDPAKYMKEKSL